MDFGTIAGFIVGTIAIFGLACKGEVMPYFDVPSVGLVFGGCLTTIITAVPISKIKKMPTAFFMSFRDTSPDPTYYVKRLMEFAEMARRDGILALENILPDVSDEFMRKSLQLAIDGTDPEIITEIMNTEIEGIERRHEDNRRGWEFCRNTAPSWGAMGTVIGLVQMVKGGVEDPNALIMGIAVALLTTFYGSLVSTWLVGPLCDKLAIRTSDEILVKTLVLKGVMSIQAGDNPRVVQQKLYVFLDPSQRKTDDE